MLLPLKPFPPQPACPTHPELDLKLLWFLGDQTVNGFRRHVELFLAAFAGDVRSAHSIIKAGEDREIHRIAHRLLAHAKAVKCEPLTQLAEALHAEPLALDAVRRATILAELDRAFDQLRSTFGSIQTSTTPA